MAEWSQALQAEYENLCKDLNTTDQKIEKLIGCKPKSDDKKNFEGEKNYGIKRSLTEENVFTEKKMCYSEEKVSEELRPTHLKSTISTKSRIFGKRLANDIEDRTNKDSGSEETLKPTGFLKSIIAPESGSYIKSTYNDKKGATQSFKSEGILVPKCTKITTNSLNNSKMFHIDEKDEVDQHSWTKRTHEPTYFFKEKMATEQGMPNKRSYNNNKVKKNIWNKGTFEPTEKESGNFIKGKKFDYAHLDIVEENLGTKVTLKSTIGKASSKNIKTRASILREQKSDAKGMSRNKRMYELLLGTLNQFKEDESKHDLYQSKKEKVEKKLEENQEKEREEFNNERSLLFADRNEKKVLIKYQQQKVETVVGFESWEKKKKCERNFLRTKANPRLMFLPTNHNSTTKKMLESSQMEIDRNIACEKEKTLLILTFITQEAKMAIMAQMKQPMLEIVNEINGNLTTPVNHPLFEEVDEVFINPVQQHKSKKLNKDNNDIAISVRQLHFEKVEEDNSSFICVTCV